MVKEFEINGKLIVNDVEDHREFLELLYRILHQNGIHFIGSTKKIKEVVHI